jgi:hypothetical protein
MTLVFGVPLSVLLGQLLLGLINGAFYALLSLGLAIIFGLLRIINFAHGAQYMLGAFVAFLGLNYLGVSYWFALVLAPLLVGCLGMAIERGLLRRIAGEDHLYGLLLTFGLALIVEGSFVKLFGVSGSSYPMPELLRGQITTTLKKGLTHARRNEDRELVSICSFALNAASELADLLDQGRMTRVTADYRPDQPVDFSTVPDFSLNAVTVKMARSWRHRADIYMQTIEKAWGQIGA